MRSQIKNPSVAGATVSPLIGGSAIVMCKLADGHVRRVRRKLTGGEPDQEAIGSGVHAGSMGQDAGQVQRVFQHTGKVLR